MKFNKYNNPRKKSKRTIRHSDSYVIEKKNELYEALAKCKTEEEKNNLIKAYNISMD